MGSRCNLHLVSLFEAPGRVLLLCRDLPLGKTGLLSKKAVRFATCSRFGRRFTDHTCALDVVEMEDPYWSLPAYPFQQLLQRRCDMRSERVRSVVVSQEPVQALIREIEHGFDFISAVFHEVNHEPIVMGARIPADPDSALHKVSVKDINAKVVVARIQCNGQGGHRVIDEILVEAPHHLVAQLFVSAEIHGLLLQFCDCRIE